MTSPRRLTRLTLLLTCAALLLGACGGDGADTEQYEAGLAKMAGQLDDAQAASKASGDTLEPEARRAALGDAHDALAAAAKTAGDLDPPDDARTAHTKLVAALEDYADLFDRLARLGENDPSESELYSEAGEIVQRLDDANQALDKAGYSVDGDGDGDT